jgi:NAD(P)-dependent dehydrogenase (short-subunit alcohol dehydrogenase family)
MSKKLAQRQSKRILITGVSRGLGRALAERFIELGHVIVGCATNGRAIGELRERFGQPHSFQVVDVASDADVKRWAVAVEAATTPPDLLLNNAALINRNAACWEVSAEEFDRLIDVNIKGVANVIRHFAPPMIARGSGVIVNFSSGWGRSVSPEVAPYCASKWAIEGLTRALAQELPRGMAAVPVNPGVIHTDMLRSCFGEEAVGYPEPAAWANRAAEFLLALGRKDNGQALTIC